MLANVKADPKLYGQWVTIDGARRNEIITRLVAHKAYFKYGQMPYPEPASGLRLRLSKHVLTIAALPLLLCS